MPVGPMSLSTNGTGFGVWVNRGDPTDGRSQQRQKNSVRFPWEPWETGGRSARAGVPLFAPDGRKHPHPPSHRASTGDRCPVDRSWHPCAEPGASCVLRASTARKGQPLFEASPSGISLWCNTRRGQSSPKGSSPSSSPFFFLPPPSITRTVRRRARRSPS